MTYLISSLLAFFGRISIQGKIHLIVVKRVFYFLLVSFLYFFPSNQVYAQCINTSYFLTGTAPAPGGTTQISFCNYAGEYNQINSLVAGQQYTFTSSVTSDYLTVTQGTSNGTIIANGTQPLTLTATVSGTYFVHINLSAACGTDVSCHSISISAPNTPCSGTPNAGTATISSATGCTGQNFTLNATGLSTGSGLTYQWQSAPTASGPWTNILGGTTASFATSTSTVGQTFYQLISTCAGVSSTSSTISYTASSCGIVPTTGVSYITSCGTTVYDAGGASGNYANSSAGTLIIRPTSMDQVITVTGTYATENGFDYLGLDEGEDSNPYTAIDGYTGSGTITPFTTSGPGIPLVVHLTSDGGGNNTGFVLTISCACAKPTAITLTTTNAPCGGTGSVTVNTVTAPDQKPWVMATFENDALPTLPWLPTAAPNAWFSGNAAHLTGNNNQMRLTQAQNSQNGALVFQSYGENQAELLGYFDIWIDDNGVGDGSADGLSFSYGPNIATTPTPIFAAGGYESGVGEGVVISFDTYNSGAAYPNCTGTNFRNIYLLYNNTVLACQSNFDNTFYRGNQNLCSVYISPTGRLFLTVNVNGVDTDVFPGGVQLPASYLTDNKSSWKSALAARTGGVNDRHRVDNINLYHFYDYEYSINGTAWQSSPTFSGLAGGNHTMYVRLKGITSCSYTQVFTISAPVASTEPTSITGTPTVCSGASTTLTSSGGTLGTDAEDIWYEDACPMECYKQEWLTQPFPSFANMTVNSVTNGVLNVTSSSNDPMMDMSGLGSFDPAICRYVNIRYKVISGTANNVEIFFYNTANPGAVGGQTGFGSLISDNTWHTVSVDMWADLDYQTGGNITGWRFDWATAAGVTMDIDFISLSNLPIFATGPSITVAPTTSTTYFTLKQGTCNTTSCVSQLVTISSNPLVSITGSTTACNGTAVTLTASGGGTYLWSTGATTAAISVTPAVTTTYTVTVTLSGCAFPATHTLTITDNVPTTFTQIPPQCQSQIAVSLPTSSTNSPAITGTWTPATISTTTLGTTNYVFTPTTGVCATPFTMPIQIISCAEIGACNILVYQIGNNATATSSAPVTILEFPPNFTNATTPTNPVQITAPVTGANNLTNISGGATGNTSSTLTGYMNTYNGFTAIPGYSDPDNTPNIESSSDNERVNIINALPAQSTTVINAINTFFGGTSIIRGAVPIDATRFYCFGAGPSTTTSGIFYWDGTAFTQIYTDGGCVLNTTSSTNNIRSIDIFNGQLYMVRRPITGALGFLFAVGNGLPTVLSTLSSPLASYPSQNAVSAFVNSFSISPDGSTMYTTDNSSSGNGITKWIKTTNGNAFAQVATTARYSSGNSVLSTANKYMGLAVDWSVLTSVKIYVTTSTASSSGANYLVGITDAAGYGPTVNSASWPANAAAVTQVYTATNNCTGCKYTGVDFAPTITANLSTFNACVGTPVAVTASALQSAVSPLNYQWYKIPSPNANYVDYFGSVIVTGADGTGGTTDTFTPSVAGTYFCEVIGASCAKFRTRVVVVSSTLPTVSATPGTCSGSTADVTVTASGATAGYNISWTGAATGDPVGTEIASSGGTYNITGLASGSYTITALSANGCSASTTATVSCSACSNPVIDAQPANITECVNAAQQLSVTASGTSLTYQWYSNTSASTTGGTLLTGETNATYTPPSGTAGTFYYYVIVNSSTCATTSNAVTVIVTATPSTPTISGTATFCTGGSTVLTSSEATGNQWYNGGVLMSGETGTTLTVTAAGTYTVIATVGGCPSAVSAGTTVTVTATPNTPTISGTATFCTGGSTVLTSSATTGNQWYNGGVLMSGETGTTLTVTAAGTYTVIATVGGCPSAVSAGTTLTVTATPNTPTISGTATFCTGGSTVLTSSATTGNQWYNGGVLMSGETGTTLTVTAAGTYTVIATEGGCPSAVSAGTTVTVNPNPTISGGTTVCFNATLQLSGTGTPAVSNPWTSINTGIITVSNTGLVSTVGIGSATITYTDINGCTDTESISVTDIIDWANLQSPGSGQICVGGTFDIYGQLYNTGTSNTVGAGVAATGVTVEFGYSTSNSNPSTWTNWSTASFNSFGGGTDNDEYMGTFSGLAQGTYYYTFRYQINGCSWQYGGFNAGGGGFWDGTTNVSGVLTVNPIPTVDVTCANICAGATTTVTATPTPAGNYTYNWTVPSGAAAQGSSVASFTTGVTGIYSVIITNTTTGCVSLSDGCTISIQAQPSLIFLSPP